MRIADEFRLPDAGRQMDSYAYRRTEAAELRCCPKAQLERVTSDVLLTQVSHDLRTPLTSIRAFAEILVDSPDLNADTTQRFLLIILEESQRLGCILDEFLDLRLPEITADALEHGANGKANLLE